MRLSHKHGADSLSLYDEMEKRLAKKVRQQLFTSCVLFPQKREDEYIYVGDAFRKFGSWLLFWKKRKSLSTRDKLIGKLLK